MNKKVYKTLEFDKILKKVAAYAVLEKTKDKIYSLEPKTDIENVRLVLNETDFATRAIIKAGSPPIYNYGDFSDMTEITKRLEVTASLNTRELLAVATLFKSSRLLKGYLSDCNFPVFDGYIEMLIVNKHLEDEIFSKIISEEEIADNASDTLYSIRRKKISSQGKIRETLQKFTNSPNFKKYLQNATVTLRNERFVLPVKQEYRNEIQGLVHDSSDSGATVFIEPMSVVNLNNELKELDIKEKAEIEKILFDLSSMCAGYFEEIKTLDTLISNLDLIFSKAKYSLNIKGELPKLNDKGIIILKKARHPLIPSEKVVPIDVCIDEGFDTLVITGPNTGGKTVSLKTIGLLTLMAQSGILIPAFMGSEIAVFKEIYADIGDEQSIEQSLSTFSSHMKNIVSILNNITFDNLVLFDELGAGTDPTEGAALAIEIIEYLRKRGARVAATTHYPELKLYALSGEKVCNASLEFDVETLMPTYRLIMGMPGRSNAFAISKKLGMSDEVIDNAQLRISKDALKFEDILTTIDKNRIEAEKEKEEAESLKKQVEELKKELKKKQDDAYSKSHKIIEKARAEALLITEEAREKAEEIISDLNKKAKSQAERAKAVGDARKKLKEQRDKQAGKLSDENKKGKNPLNIKDIKIGLTVMFEEIDAEVTVDTLPDKDGNLTVLAGIMKVKTNISKLYACETKANKEKKSARSLERNSSNVSIKNREFRPELDLRGMNLEEAEFVTEKFIDDAILGHIPSIVIIHGKGSGILRSGIHALLKKNKAIKSFRLGTFGEGEAGVTIAELK